ncbi:MAG TPA: TetR/AcrR family transcriptional regulator [Acidimicrobiales bacterium]|nr:TetR/AcrR family transcriptional regulator [Acidimicrobiales bacterium]
MTPAGVDTPVPETPAVHTHGPGHGPGRPRSVKADRAIVAATVHLLAEEGYSRLSMEGVAAHAGVAKTTIYRRWPCKSDLVVHCLRCLTEKLETAPDTGRVRDDLVAFMGQMVDKMRRSDAGRIMPGILVELARNPELAQAFRQGFVEPRRASMVKALRRAIDRGEIRPEIDVDLVVDVTVGVFQHRLMVTGMVIDDDMPERLADLVLEGISLRP